MRRANVRFPPLSNVSGLGLLSTRCGHLAPVLIRITEGGACAPTSLHARPVPLRLEAFQPFQPSQGGLGVGRLRAEAAWLAHRNDRGSASVTVEKTVSRHRYHHA